MDVSDVNEDLMLDKTSSGDRPSIFALGLAVSAALKQGGTAVVMTDVLGRIRLMPTEAVQVLSRPKLEAEELNQMHEDDAIGVLVKQGATDAEILEYLAQR